MLCWPLTFSRTNVVSDILCIKRIKLFDLKQKISFRFNIEKKTNHHFDIETKCSVLFKLSRENKTAESLPLDKHRILIRIFVLPFLGRMPRTDVEYNNLFGQEQKGRRKVEERTDLPHSFEIRITCDSSSI
jgi:hypothetical protein